MDEKLEISKIDNIFIISDTHFGIRANSIEWLDIQKQYFYDYLIPFLEENACENDIILHCGDVFDNRQSLNLLVMNSVIDIFEEISKILPVYILIGNHDLYNKSTNDINSVKTLGYINNINVITRPKKLHLENSKTIMLFPWEVSDNKIRDFLLETSADYLFCHLDINTFKFNNQITIDNGIDIDVFRNYATTISGHVHHRHSKENIHYIGCPYQLSRSDIGNQKGLHILNTSSGELTFVENNISPKFIRMELDDILNNNIKNVQRIIKNNYVDVLMDEKISNVFPFSKLVDLLSEYKKINLIIKNKDDHNINYDLHSLSTLVKFDIMNFCDLFIDGIDYSDKLKTLAKQKILELYNKAKE